MSNVKNRLFAKYGHDCQISLPIEDLYMFQPNTNILTQIWHNMIKWRMASEINYRTLNFMQSQKRIYMEHKQHLEHIYVTHPFSDLRYYWETFMMMIFFMLFIMIPLELSTFMIDVNHDFTSYRSWKVCRFCCDCICIMDVLVSFFTGYCDYEHNKIVLEPKKIAAHYLFTYLIFDVVSSIPFSLSKMAMRQGTHKYLIYISLMKFLRFISFLRYTKNFAETHGIHNSTYKMVMVTICFSLYYHLVSCGTIYMLSRRYVDISHDYKEQQASANKHYQFDLLQHLGSTYAYTFYKSALLINHVSFIHKDTIEMKIYTIIITFLSRVLYMWIVAITINILIAKSSASRQYNEMVVDLKAYMRHKQLPEYLQRRLLGFYEFRFQKSYFRESEIMNTISGQLRQDITMHCCRKLVENVKFFAGLPLSLIIRIVTTMQVEIYLTNDVVIKAGADGDSMYFIATGTVAVYSPVGIEICHLSDGECFGEVALVVKKAKRIASIVAVETCELYRLVQNEFARAILPYPDLLRKIEKTAFDRLEHVN